MLKVLLNGVEPRNLYFQMQYPLYTQKYSLLAFAPFYVDGACVMLLVVVLNWMV
jgi:hypothetical protein